MEYNIQTNERRWRLSQERMQNAWRYAEAILANVDGQESSPYISTGTSEDEEVGLTSLMRVEQRGNEIWLDVEHTLYGNEVTPEERYLLERYTLAQTRDGRYFLSTSGRLNSLSEAILMEPEVTQEQYNSAHQEDQQRLDESMHSASFQEIERAADLLEIAMLRAGGKNPSFDNNDVDFYSGMWRWDADSELWNQDVYSADDGVGRGEIIIPAPWLSPALDALKSIRARLRKMRGE